MKKLIFGVLLIPLLLIIVGITYLSLPWLIIGIGTASGPNPPKPEVKYGEFPFRLVYEINGEEVVVEDTVICKYDGIGMNEAVGKYRKWKSYLKSNGEEYIILLQLFNDTNIIFPTEKPEYYMGEIIGEERKLSGNAVMSYKDGSRLITAEQLKKEYGIVLISWEPSPPITNSFK